MNAHQRRKDARKVWSDHFRWPLGTLVKVQPGHHSPAAIGRTGKVGKHGYPCTHQVDCIVAVPEVVMDETFGSPRFGHYVKFKHLRKVQGGAA